jgi:hypothetical protein
MDPAYAGIASIAGMAGMAGHEHAVLCHFFDFITQILADVYDAL